MIKRLAADIFENRFTHSFVEAGISAAQFIRQKNAKTYESFWGLKDTYDRLIEMGNANERADWKDECNTFKDIIFGNYPTCRIWDGITRDPDNWSISANHQKIQYQQIVCTDNMVSVAMVSPALLFL